MKAKKSIKRLSVLLVSLALLLCMLPTAALAHTSSGPTFDGTASGSLTINKTNGAGAAITDTSLQYSIYKIATVGQTSTGGAVSVQYTYDSGVILAGGGAATGTVPTGVTAAAYDTTTMTAHATQTNTGGTGTLTFSGLPLGLYLVKETVTPAGVSQSNDFLVSIPMSTTVSGNSVWDYDPVATPKNTVVDGTVSKGITSGATLVSGSTYTASLGDSVTYAISAKIPTTFTVTPYTTYTITDTPATGLVIDKDGAGAAGSFAGITVSVGGTTLTRGTHYTITNDTGGTGFVVQLITDVPTGTTPGTQAAALTNGAVVTIAYNAKLSPTATGSSFANTVAVNSQYNTAGGGTVTPPAIIPPAIDPPPTIVTYNYALQKVDGNNSNAPLAGAKFAIQNSSGSYLAWTSTNGWTVATGLSDPNLYTFTSATASSAIVPFNGLAGGSYNIVELSAPAGYSQLTAAIPVTISATTTADANTTGGGAGYSIQVVNSLANTFTLPGTGGMGIYLYTIGGVLLIGAAIVLFARNRKRQADNA